MGRAYECADLVLKRAVFCYLFKVELSLGVGADGRGSRYAVLFRGFGISQYCWENGRFFFWETYAVHVWSLGGATLAGIVSEVRGMMANWCSGLWWRLDGDGHSECPLALQGGRLLMIFFFHQHGRHN